MATTNDLKNGLVLRIDGKLWTVVQFQHVKPGKGPAFVRTTLKDVLSSRDFGEARLAAKLLTKEPPFELEGRLTLRAETRPVTLTLERQDDRLLGEITIVPSLWGIRPYRALGGTLKLQDRVRITIDAGAEWLTQGAELNPAIELTWIPRSSRGSLRPSIHH